jgi:hypothetical protein
MTKKTIDNQLKIIYVYDVSSYSNGNIQMYIFNTNAHAFVEL